MRLDCVGPTLRETEAQRYRSALQAASGVPVQWQRQRRSFRAGTS